MLVYFIYPLVNFLSRELGWYIPRWWLDVTWIFLFVVTIVTFLNRRPVRLKLSHLLAFNLLTTALVVKFLIPISKLFQDGGAYVPIAMEAKPLFYFIFVLLWIRVFGVPTSKDFVFWGRILAFFLMFEFVYKSFSSNTIIRVKGSGEVNYDAMLLVISASLLLYEHRYLRLRRVRAFHMLVTLLTGIAITLSRTAILTEIFLLLVYSRLSGAAKFFGLVSLAALGLLAFQSRGLSFSPDTWDRFYMWKAAYDLFLNHPLGAAIGFGPNALPVRIPPQLYSLWVEIQSQGWGLSGIYPYNFHAFWLRFSITWGVFVGASLLVFALILATKVRSPVGALGAVFLLQGLTMGTIYLSNVGIPLFLAFALALQGARAYPKARVFQQPIGDNRGLRS